MRFKRVLERGSPRPRLAVYDDYCHEWVPIHQLLRANKVADPELEEALDSECPLAFLGPAATGLREKLSGLLTRVQSRKPGSWDIDTARAVLPFNPQGFRDFSLYMGHMSGASKATVKQNPSYILQAVFMGLGRMARLPLPRLSFNHIFHEVPVHYHGNHLSFVSDGEEVSWPCYTDKLDYELEVAVVICKDIKNATIEGAQAAIGGFCIINDFSARDVQPWEMAETGFGFPKSKNFCTSLGTEVVTADEILPRIFSMQGMEAEVRVNGEVWGHGNTNDPSRVHSIQEMVAYASLGETIKRGEVLGLGTLPTCCGLEVNRWLREGDVVTLSVTGLGSLTNAIGRREVYPRDWIRHEPSSFKHLSYRRLRDVRDAEGGAQEDMDGYKPPKLFKPLAVLVVAVLLGVCRLAWTLRHYPFDPVKWESPPPLKHRYHPTSSSPPEEGGIPINYALTGAEHLFLNEVVGPESLAFGLNHELYLSLNDGRVVRVDATYGNMETVFFTGGVIKAKQLQLQQQLQQGGSTKGAAALVLPNGVTEKELMAWCHEEIQAGRQTVPTETLCGRPLGMRLVPKSKLLYICDAYHGIFTLHVDTMQVQHIVTIDSPGSSRTTTTNTTNTTNTTTEEEVPPPIADRPLLFTNTMDITSDGGTIYFTDSSYKFGRAEHAIDVMDGAPRGRLLRYDTKKQVVETILCGLHFANGVQLISKPGGGRRQQQLLLVAESTRFRILQVDLQALAKADANTTRAAITECGEDAPLPPFVTIFADALPGLPDNIVMLPEGGGDDALLYVGMGTRNLAPFSLFPFLYQRVWLRHLICLLVPVKLFHHYTPKDGLVAVLNQRGELLHVYQDPTGRTPFLSEAAMHPITGDLLLGSFRNRFLGRVSKSTLQKALGN